MRRFLHKISSWVTSSVLVLIVALGIYLICVGAQTELQRMDK